MLCELGGMDSNEAVRCMNTIKVQYSRQRTRRFYKRTKYIDIRYYLIRGSIEYGLVVLQYNSMTGMEAEMITKPIPFHFEHLIIMRRFNQAPPSRVGVLLKKRLGLQEYMKVRFSD